MCFRIMHIIAKSDWCKSLIFPVLSILLGYSVPLILSMFIKILESLQKRCLFLNWSTHIYFPLFNIQFISSCPIEKHFETHFLECLNIDYVFELKHNQCLNFQPQIQLQIKICSRIMNVVFHASVL